MQQDWIGALLRAMRAPLTPSNIEFLRNWGNWESAKPGSPATYNWLSTNRDEKNQYRIIDPTYGTRAYPNMQVGLQETLATLVHEMPELIKAFRSGAPSFNDPSVQTAFNRWGPEGVGHPGRSAYINAIAGTLRPTPTVPARPRRPKRIQPGAKPVNRQAVTDVLFKNDFGPRYPVKKTP